MSKLLDAIRGARKMLPAAHPDGDPGPTLDVENSRILVVYLFRALGDAVLLAPAIKALFDAGAAEIDILVQAAPAKILKLVDLPWRVHALSPELDLPPDDPAFRGKAVVELADKLTSKLRRRKYDIAIELTARADVDARRWIKVTDAEHRLGWIASHENAASVGLTFGTPDIRLQTDRHWSRFQILPMRCLGVTRPAFDFSFLIDDAARDAARERHTTEPRVVIVPGSRQAKRRWSPDGFARIGRAVTKLGGSVVVCGSPDESKLVRGIVKQIGEGAQAYTGKNLKTLLALLDDANVVVTNDTGPMHLSFLLDTPTLAVFTWMSPLVWGPPLPGKRFVVMNATRSSDADDEEGILTRAAIHYVEGLLEQT